MLTTFVIGLREGLEASLIVGIIAAFLRRYEPDAPRRRSSEDARPPAGGHRSAEEPSDWTSLRNMWLGVGAAVLLCLAVGIVLALVSASLPQRQQEALESVVAVIAVAMITYMILWMNSHSRGLKGELESAAASALARGSSLALIAMAFLAVLREGFETAVFLLAAFDNAVSPVASAVGVILGIACAVLLGWLIYRGGTRINLSRFFRLTGIVLVLVAGGLLMSALRGAYEAGWLAVGQQPVVDLTWLIQPGSIQSALLGGLFGIQPQPVVIEVVAWVLYVGTMLTVVLWPRSHRLSRRQAGRLLLIAGGAAGVVAALLAVLVPPGVPVTGPQQLPATADAAVVVGAGDTISVALTGTTTVTVVAFTGHTLTVHLDAKLAPGDPAVLFGTSAVEFDADVSLDLAGTSPHGTFAAGSYGSAVQIGGTKAPTGMTLTGAQVADLNGGRRPIGLTAVDTDVELAAAFLDSWRMTAVYDATSAVVMDAQIVDFSRTLRVVNSRGSSVSVGSVLTMNTTSPVDGDQLAAAVDVREAIRRHETWGVVVPIEIGVAAAIVGLYGATLTLRPRRRPASGSAPAAGPPSATHTAIAQAISLPADPVPEPAIGHRPAGERHLRTAPNPPPPVDLGPTVARFTDFDIEEFLHACCIEVHRPCRCRSPGADRVWIEYHCRSVGRRLDHVGVVEQCRERGWL